MRNTKGSANSNFSLPKDGSGTKKRKAAQIIFRAAFQLSIVNY